MTENIRRIFTSEFSSKAAQLVLDQALTIEQAAIAMDVSKSTILRWVNQLKVERKDAEKLRDAVNSGQSKIKALEERVERIELEKEILKRVTARLMSDSLKNLR